MSVLTSEQQQLISLLEDTFVLLQKTQTNLKKCSKQRLTRGYLETKSLCIADYWKTFKATHQQLTKCTPKEMRGQIPYFQNEDYFIVEDLYTCLQADLKDMLISKSSSSKDTNTNPSTSSTNTSQVHESFVKLPRIELPNFNGNYEDWPTFRDMFTSLVHNNTSLSKVQKLQYLKSSVVGECESLLKHINVTEDNYTEAWNILAKRYGNKRLIVNSSLKKLFSQKKITTVSATHLKNLLDTTSQCLNNLKNQDIPIESWDQLIIYNVVQKLDIDTHRAWEEYSYHEDSEVLPTWCDLKRFLEIKFRTLEMVNPVTVIERILVTEKSFHASSDEKRYDCDMCHADHTLCHCKEFCKLQPSERSEFIMKNKLCFNCLMSGHSVSRCRNQMSCRKCNRRHHTLLHQPNNDGQSNTRKMHHNQIQQDEGDQSADQNENQDSSEELVTISTHFASQQSTALLATALVPVKDTSGRFITLRALIDQGSQANFISERAAQLLRVKRSSFNGVITGVGTTKTTVKHITQLEIHSTCDNKFKLAIKAYVMSAQLTSQLPPKTIPSTQTTWQHLHGISLADSSFNSPGRIDMLLGVEVYAQILKPEILKGPPGSPCAQNTSLGWILFGNIQAETSDERIVVMHHQFDIDNTLKNLWEVETDTKENLTKDDEICENIYKERTTRNQEEQTGKSLSSKGNTKEGALKRLQHLERRFHKNEYLKKKYTTVMEEDTELQHMEEVPQNELKNPAVFLPHHLVIKEESKTTKVRPVFDASFEGTNNILLNDEVLVRPSQQNPTDIASREMLAHELKNCSIWWHEPEHLKQKEINIERLLIENIDLEKRKTINTYLKLDEPQSKTMYDKIGKFETLTELLNTVVYAKRFLDYKSIGENNIDSALTTKMEKALISFISITQAQTLAEDIITHLKGKKKVKLRKSIKDLNPFLNVKETLKVGGKFTKTNLELDQKHPFTLNAKNSLTLLITADAQRTFHDGNQNISPDSSRYRIESRGRRSFKSG